MADNPKENLYVAAGSVDPKLNPEIVTGPNYEGLKPLGDPYFSVPFRGGATTRRDRAQLQSGEYSMVQNMRGRHPGFVKRKGCAKFHSTHDSNYQVVTLYQFKKNRVSDTHFYAQMSDGDVLESTNAPPSIITGAFGSVTLHAGTSSGMIPASWGSLRDMMIYSNGSDQHQIVGGTGSYISRFIVHDDPSAAPGDFPSLGYDYTNEVTDGSTSTHAPLDALEDLANDFECVFIMTPIPIESLYVTMGSNVNAVVDADDDLEVHYWDGTAWAAVSNLSDGTETGDKKFAQSGEISWDTPSDEYERFLYGQNGFWYRLSLSDGSDNLSASVDITKVTYGSSNDTNKAQDLQNVWDGVRTPAVEVQLYENTDGVYYTFSSSAAEIDDMEATNDILYFSSADPICGFYVDVGNTPNTGTTATLTVSYWNGKAWAAATVINDGSGGFAQSGWVLLNRHTQEPTQFNNLQYKAYWYKITTNQTLSSDVIIGISCMPFFEISDLGSIGYCNAVWRERACYTFGWFGEYLYVSSSGNALALNGSDYGILKAGDGRSNRVVAAEKFQNELMVWQEETGVEGGCTTLFEGYSPLTFGKLVLSSRIGAMNAKSVTVVDGVITSVGSDEGSSEKTLAFWISRYGVCVSDGNNVTIISDPINNYFDLNETECITRGKEDEHWLAYDSSENVIRIGLATAGALVPNIFPVFDLIDNVWYFDSLAQPLSCMCECSAGSAKAAGGGSVDAPIIQLGGATGGGTDDGFVYLLNYGTNDVSTAIDSYVQMELNAFGEYMLLREMLVRAKAQTGNLDITITKNALSGVAKTAYSTAAETTSHIVRRHRINTNITDQLISLKFQGDGASESLSLYDLALRLYLVGER